MSRLVVAALVVLAASGLVTMALLGNRTEPAKPIVAEDEEQAAADKTLFAADRVLDPPPKGIDFNGKRAMGYLDAICKIGPRMSGTPGMREQQELLQKHFENLGGQVVYQTFSAKQASRPKAIEMANLIISWHPERKKRVILCSHYDTRPIADQETDPRKWREKFVSANDGGSGVAFLMEMAHHVKDLKTTVGIDFVFFDGEEYIFDPRPGKDKYFFGSEHFARKWRGERNRPDYTAAILLDMIAGANVRFPVEGHSWLRAKGLCQEIWGIAAELRTTAFLPRIGERVLDDHMALLNTGIPAIDIIDFEYPHWHRLSDVPENCAPDGMEQVAKVLAVWLQRMK